MAGWEWPWLPDNLEVSGMALVDVEDIQARLDDYKTNKQRKQRLAELQKMLSDDGYVSLNSAIEIAALRIRLRKGLVLTAQYLSDNLCQRVGSGEVLLHVHQDGELKQIPPDAIVRREVVFDA